MMETVKLKFMKIIANKKIHPGNLLLMIIAIAILVSAVAWFTKYFFTKNQYLETNDAQVESYINPVSARVSGYIRAVKFEEHTVVKQGDTLVLIDDREYREKVTEAEAAVEDARGKISVLTVSIESAETGTLVDKDQIAGAKARLVQQSRDINRYKNLVKEEAATGSDLDLVQSRYDVSQSDYSAAQNSLKTSYAKIREMRAGKVLLIADLKIKNAQLELARINLSYTVIRAPYTGRMGRKTIMEGQQIQAGQPLVSIVNEKDKWVTANFKETQISGMFVGQAVDIRVDAIPGKVFHGQIAAISASTGAQFSLLPPDNATGNFVKIVQRFPVRIRFNNSDTDPIRAGMNVSVAVKKEAP
jgi:membrane fusion protein (multidrug efflux system)